MLTIRTNYHWHNFLYGYELSDTERADFDYIGADSFDPDTGEKVRSEELDCHDFFRYRGVIYDPSEFMAVPSPLNGWALEHDDSADPEFSKWQGYQSDSYFSGVVIRYSDDCERYQVGTYMS